MSPLPPPIPPQNVNRWFGEAERSSLQGSYEDRKPEELQNGWIHEWNGNVSQFLYGSSLWIKGVGFCSWQDNTGNWKLSAHMESFKNQPIVSPRLICTLFISSCLGSSHHNPLGASGKCFEHNFSHTSPIWLEYSSVTRKSVMTNLKTYICISAHAWLVLCTETLA